ncbi:hypothetical protein [Rhizobium leguminosarum]|nr:hypothetical protein [Rhizobium leguminosarum]MBB5256018.1 hypothetical protein [Rhizobium leguminosarum]MDX6001333.1 hypothetical protein [Rhizobium leguminosarum]
MLPGILGRLYSFDALFDNPSQIIGLPENAKRHSKIDSIDTGARELGLRG